MTMWWDTEEAANAVLEAVDSNDPDVGAGVVALGLHGLGAAALRRAAPSLALNPGSVVAALDEVDLGPVSAAWQRLGGEDDDVALMKSDADVAAFRVIPMLRQAGLGPEQAVQRAASLYGLPPKSAVSVVAKFQAETGPAVDAAALGEVMHYASSAGDELVAKAYERRGYHGDDPDERDESGQFKAKGAGGPPPPRARGRLKPAPQAAAQSAPAAQPAVRPKDAQLKGLSREQRSKRRKKRENRQVAQAAQAAQQETSQKTRQKTGVTQEKLGQLQPLQRMQRLAPIKTRKWEKKDDDIGDKILREVLNYPIPGPDEKNTMKDPGAQVFAFIPLAIAQRYDDDVNLHAAGHTVQKYGSGPRVVPGGLFTENGVRKELERLHSLGALEYVREDGDDSDEHVVIGEVPMALVTFKGYEMGIEQMREDRPVAHPSTMLTFQEHPRHGRREPLDALETGEPGEDGTWEPHAHAVQIYDTANLSNIAGIDIREIEEEVAAFKKAYERRGYHGDDPDERDAGGQFAPKGAPRSASRGRLKPAAEAVSAPQQKEPQQKVKPRFAQPAPMSASTREARRRRRKKRERRQVAQAQVAARQTQAQQTQQSQGTEKPGQLQRVEPLQRLTAKKPFPKRPPGTARPPVDAPVNDMLDLDKMGAAAAILTSSDDPDGYRLMQAIDSLGDAEGMEDAANGWKARTLGQMSGTRTSPYWDSLTVESDLNAPVADSTEALKDSLLRPQGQTPWDDAVAMADKATEEMLSKDLGISDGEHFSEALGEWKVESTGTVLSAKFGDVYPPVLMRAADRLSSRMGEDVKIHVTSVVEGLPELGGEVRKPWTGKDRKPWAGGGTDWELYGAVEGELYVDLKGALDPPWIVIERVADGARGDSAATMYDGSGLQAFRDEAATLLLRKDMKMFQVLDALGIDRSQARFPANLPVNIAVLDHGVGYAF